MLEHYVEIRITVYPLRPSNGCATVSTYHVVAEPGYLVDEVATITIMPTILRESTARQIAAMLSDMSPDAIRVERRWFYRDRDDHNARAITEEQAQAYLGRRDVVEAGQ